MNWKNLKLNRKFTLAFGSIIVLLIVVCLWAITGIRGIVGDAEEVIGGNALRGDLDEMYVQHLLWAQKVNELLTNDDVTELEVQTDHTQCAFGKWYYGEGKKEAIKIAPGLSDLLNEFDSPHMHLHASAIEIKKSFSQADRKLGATLREAKADHLIWAHRVKDVLVNNQRVSAIDVQKDPTLCNFGEWLHSESTKKLRGKYPELDRLCLEIEEPHQRLHNSVYAVESYYKRGALEAGKNHYMNNTKPITYEVLAIIDKVITWNDNSLKGMDAANKIYSEETLVYLEQLGGLFDNIIAKSADFIMTDEVMLHEASKTSAGVIILSVLISILAVILAVVIARGIIKPINKGVLFARKLADGNLTVEIEVDQEDEIGLMARALNDMSGKLREVVRGIRVGADTIASASMQMSSTSQEMSQGASEQASSVEEVSSSMEEMTANIEQNTESAQGTEKIALNATAGIKEGSNATTTAVSTMRNIAEKIQIINDIAFQTNILALNAAVEAARAGEHGRGFAVVAAEVRKLAERSKIAADEIMELSGNGVQIVDTAGGKLAEIVPEIEKTAQMVQEIAAASIEQRSGSDQINSALQQLNNVTQQNAAASEELATSAEELASQADQLKDTISYFDVGQNAQLKSNISKPGIVGNKEGQIAARMVELSKTSVEYSDDTEFEKF